MEPVEILLAPVFIEQPGAVLFSIRENVSVARLLHRII
jgi:hypothetical protein